MPGANILPNKGDSIDLEIESLAFGARGVARTGGFVWFVDFAIPGQTVRAKVTKRRQGYGEARIDSILSPSPDQVPAPCQYFGICGGCRLQHLQYEAQVKAKTNQVRDIMERIGGFSGELVMPALPSETIYHYRNKMEFTFSDRRWLIEKNSALDPVSFALGMHVPARFDKILDIEACLLQSDRANVLYQFVNQRIRETGLPPYGVKTHTGIWRFLVIREGKNTGDHMLNLVTSGQEPQKTSEAIGRLMHKLLLKHPELTTVVQSITDRKGMAAYAESEKLLLGRGAIKERIGERQFSISPGAFFQTNTLQATRLFQTIADLAAFSGDETVLDLYCGTGAIGITIADKVKRILGIESVASAVEDGRKNAELNGLSNIQFIQADLKTALSDGSTDAFGRPDVVILDPPRGGTHPRTIENLSRLAPSKIVYVSCNPPLMARDMQSLCTAGYRISAIQPVDMFPHTAHIEAVALLKKPDTG